MSKRRPEFLMEDIVQCAEKILDYTQNIAFEEFTSNSMMIDAVTRNFEIIGEASNRLPDEYKDRCPQVDWHKIRGLRNRIVHDYFGINYKIIWSTIDEYLPVLISNINLILNN